MGSLCTKCGKKLYVTDSSSACPFCGARDWDKDKIDMPTMSENEIKECEEELKRDAEAAEREDESEFFESYDLGEKVRGSYEDYCEFSDDLAETIMDHNGEDIEDGCIKNNDELELQDAEEGGYHFHDEDGNEDGEKDEEGYDSEYNHIWDYDDDSKGDDENSDSKHTPSINEEKITALEKIFSSKNTVIKARAGSGKSTLLLALVSKLINEHDVEGKNVLLLSFNRKVRERNTNDLRDQWGVNDFYGVQTFHSLAFQIVRPDDRKKVIEDQSNDYAIVELLGDIVRREAGVWFKLKYWWYLRELDKEFVKENVFTTLLGEDVKSYSEKCIADFLFEYGIEYKYEPSFDWNGYQYCPDFEIRDSSHSAIIEYWGRDDERYVTQKENKRRYWNKKSTKLIEINPSDFGDKADRSHFTNVLAYKISGAGFSLRKLTEEEEAEKAFEKRFKSITKALLGFIQYARAQCITPSKIDALISSKPDNINGKSLFFAELANYTYKKYIQYIEENDLYDFPRLLERATKKIIDADGECFINLCIEKDIKVRVNDLEWILADEFQDCSPMLIKLLQAIQKVNSEVRFVCVGDDWQAINGFASSDTEYFNNFWRYFSDSSETTLPTNLRSMGDIVCCGNNLMKGNGIPAKWETNGGEVRLLTLREIPGKDRYALMPDKYIKVIREIIEGYPMGTTYAILKRTNKFFTLSKFQFEKRIRRGLNKRHIDVSTVHKYKGSQADVVIIVNATNGNFPLLHPDRYRHEVLGITDERILFEERRLFYVALTRAIKAVYIITEENRESPFINDLRYTVASPENNEIEEIPF